MLSVSHSLTHTHLGVEGRGILHGLKQLSAEQIFSKVSTHIHLLHKVTTERTFQNGYLQRELCVDYR
jgi:hypothetical protein